VRIVDEMVLISVLWLLDMSLGARVSCGGLGRVDGGIEDLVVRIHPIVLWLWLSVLIWIIIRRRRTDHCR
jgi:hypothetical protein